MRPDVFAAAVGLALPLALISGTVSTAEAQGRNMRFAAMDKDGDGRIARDEWQGSNQSFRVHDWNGDGVLSGEEVRIGGRRVPAEEEEDFEPRRLELRDWTAQRFSNLDHNGDGRITRDEWHYDMEGFRRADRNRDNILTRAEFLGDDTRDDDREDRFVDLDLNGNGRIERREWHGSREGFDSLDQNNDGSLSWDEVMAEEPEASDVFASLDVDRSGRIERGEWHWSRGSFSQRDLNGDGVLTRNEFPAAEPAAQPGAVATTGRTIVVDATVRWTDTGITVRAGDVLTIQAEGTIQMSTDANDVADPSGARSGRRAPNAPVNSQPAGGLIAMINGTTPVYVGDRSSRLRAPVSGRLYLGVNDDHLGDNRGEYRVTISVQR